MSSFDLKDKVDVEIQATPATEIFLIDHKFQLAERGVGSIRARVDPGIYKIKFRAGSSIKEVHRELSAGSGLVRIEGPSVEYFSSAPLATARTTHEYHEDAARMLSRQVHRTLGEGSQVFVFARAWTNAGAGRHVPPVPPRHNPAEGLTLRALDGTLLVDLERETQRGRGGDPWAGANVAVAPGAYRLRVQTPRWGALEQIVIATQDWQTQIFFLQDDYGAEDHQEFRPDLADATILLAPIGAGFDPGRGELRLAELARQALAHGRTVMTADELSTVLSQRQTSPMLGLYGAHSLVAAGSHARLRPVVQSLRETLGSHPDVEALRLALDGRLTKRHPPFTVPPMLSASWSIMVAQSAQWPDLIPSGSLAAQVATHVWAAGPWLIWQADDLETVSAPLSSSLDEALTTLAQLAPSYANDVAILDGLSDTEAALLSALEPPRARRRGGFGPSDIVETEFTSALANPALALGFDLRPATAVATPAGPGYGGSAPDPVQVATALGLPPAALQVAVDGLSQKLHGAIDQGLGAGVNDVVPMGIERR
jgi:hypothetical protein